MESSETHELRKALHKEIEVFESSKKKQVEEERKDQKKFSSPNGTRGLDPQGQMVIHKGREEEEKEKAVIPVAIKDIAGHEEEEILDSKAFLKNQITRIDCEKEDDKDAGVKKHGG